MDPYGTILIHMVDMDQKGSIWICISGPHAGPLLKSPTIQGTSPNIGKHVLFLKSKIHMTPIYGSYSVGFHMDLKIMYTHLIARIYHRN